MIKVVVANGEDVKEYDCESYILVAVSGREVNTVLEGRLDPIRMVRVISETTAGQMKAMFDVKPGTPSGEVVKNLFKAAFESAYEEESTSNVAKREIIGEEG